MTHTQLRQIVLDTETTGLEPDAGHRVIEIGCVELIDRRLTSNHFHYYLQPDREIDEAAQEVHGISAEFLADKPRFAEIVLELQTYLDGAELLIHNAPFDVAFLDAELHRYGAGWRHLSDHCRITDTLQMARELHPSQKNSLDALCKRYDIDNSNRTLHGALLDSEILAAVYLAMTSGQFSLSLERAPHSPELSSHANRTGKTRSATELEPLVLAQLTSAEELAHQDWLDRVAKQNGSPSLWVQLMAAEGSKQ